MFLNLAFDITEMGVRIAPEGKGTGADAGEPAGVKSALSVREVSEVTLLGGSEAQEEVGEIGGVGGRWILG